MTAQARELQISDFLKDLSGEDPEMNEVEKYILKLLQGTDDTNNQLYSYPTCSVLWDYKEREICCLL